MSCEEIITKLKLKLGELVGVPQITATDCTVNFEKLETKKILEEHGITAEKDLWLWGRGSIYVNEQAKTTWGDTVVPIERGAEKLDELQKLGCLPDPSEDEEGRISPIHAHPRIGVSHIHHTCDLRKVNVDKLVKEWASI